ncbi:MAG: glycosyltransferase [Candidatus Peribacteria bacterium]|nr:glycosyltransferase [Candidatus Peribacteria bacterium]
MHTRIRSLYYLLNIEKFHLKHADTIISPSQFTKDEILNYHHINPEKIHVIPR